MTRDQINRYERECVNRAGVFLNRRNRRRYSAVQAQGDMVRIGAGCRNVLCSEA